MNNPYSAAPLVLKGIGERFIWEWQYGTLGGFSHALAECMARADSENLARLALGFPYEAEAMYNFKNLDQYWPNLQKLVADSKAKDTKESD